MKPSLAQMCCIAAGRCCLSYHPAQTPVAGGLGTGGPLVFLGDQEHSAASAFCLGMRQVWWILHRVMAAGGRHACPRALLAVEGYVLRS